jgi:hypothetical protein
VPLSKIERKGNIQAFVDDTHGLIIQNNNYQKTLNVLITQNMQECEALLKTLGGKSHKRKFDLRKCEITNISSKIDTFSEMTLRPKPINDHINITDPKPAAPYK